MLVGPLKSVSQLGSPCRRLDYLPPAVWLYAEAIEERHGEPMPVDAGRPLIEA